MPVTRSAARAANGLLADSQKRKADKSASSHSKRLRASKSSVTVASSKKEDSNNQLERNVHQPMSEQVVPATLTFSFEEGRKHLISVDRRFEKLFNKMPCKPFEHLETVHPFRSLTTSILGQQISWMAARSINHRFKRLFDPTLPEQATDDTRSPSSFFPSPVQVSGANIEILRSAGLSARKAEYVKDLASRFVDGRLSARKLMEASDKDLAQMLMEVRGIGRWTVDMFSIFSMRRPDILPIGDLGVQRGLLKWFLSLHSSNHSLDTIFIINETPLSNQTSENIWLPEGNAEKSSPIPLITNSEVIPPPITPRTKSSLEHYASEESELRPLPSGLSVSVLRNRLKGKKIKGAFLTPLEMEEMTESWKPYRSLGVYYMWSLSEGE
ncbi:hypothetical protein AX15_005371 [Amanita polypyramis BW_CC]|nr:hypothetical protein AX15_005371 [Amanita polypyramis BW_CC]